MLHRGIFCQWRRITNVASRNIFFNVALSILDRGKFQKWHNKCYIAEYFVNGVALSIWWNISPVASHYQCCMTEYFDIILLILDRGKFQKWHNVTSWNISPVASHHQCYIAEYFDVALSILNRGKFQKWHNKCYIAEYFINVVAVSIWQNISSVASHYQYCIVQFFNVALSILNRENFQKWHNVTSWNISSMTLRYQYGGIFRQWRRTINIAWQNILTLYYRY